MKNKIVWILPILLFSVLFLTSCSDDEKTSSFEKIKEKLVLSDERAAQVKPIFMEQADKLSDILDGKDTDEAGTSLFQKDKSGNSLDMGGYSASLAEKIDPVNKKANDKLANILTAAQIKEYNRVINRYIEKTIEESKASEPPRGGMNDAGGMRGMGGQGAQF